MPLDLGALIRISMDVIVNTYSAMLEPITPIVFRRSRWEVFVEGSKAWMSATMAFVLTVVVFLADSEELLPRALLADLQREPLLLLDLLQQELLLLLESLLPLGPVLTRLQHRLQLPLVLVVELLRGLSTEPYPPKTALTMIHAAPSGLPEMNATSTLFTCLVTVRDHVVTVDPINQKELDVSIDILPVITSNLKENAPEDVNGCQKTVEPVVDGVTYL